MLRPSGQVVLRRVSYPPGYIFPPALRRPVQQEPVQHYGLRLDRFQLDHGEPPLRRFTPAVDAGFALYNFSSVEVPQKLPRVRDRRGLAIRWPRQRFHRVTPQQFVPILFEQIAGRENVAPRHVASVRHDHANDALALQS